MKEVYVVQDRDDIRHHGRGVLGIVKTIEEAEALKAVLNGRWDGCEGCLNVEIKKVEFGIKRFVKGGYFCLHDWDMNSDIFVCRKCNKRWNKRNKGKVPKFDGIAYFDEKKKKLVFVKEKS